MRFYEILWQKDIAIPLWLVCALLVAALVGLVYLDRRARRLHRLRNCCCVCCGYNLTGNTSGVCPECGGKI